MRFDQVYRALFDYQEQINLRMILLSEATLREIYDHVVATGPRDCLELGTGYGATSCVIAAALDEIGGGTVTTIDHVLREPVGVAQLAQISGTGRHVNAVHHPAGYDWVLMTMLREQTRGTTCEPRFDFCYLDGAHEWTPDGLAALTAVKLLRPGGWLLMDDLNFRLRDHPDWEQAFPHKSAEELDVRQIGMVFDLLVMTHPDMELWTLSNGGNIGWARKIGGEASVWLPNGVIATRLAASWSETHAGIPHSKDAPTDPNVVVETRDAGALIHCTGADPFVIIQNPLAPPRPIDFVTLRLQLRSPDVETLQLFWIGGDETNFTEKHSIRCIVRASRAPQDLTFRLDGSAHARTIQLFRLDPGDRSCVVLLESVTFGTL